MNNRLWRRSATIFAVYQSHLIRSTSHDKATVLYSKTGGKLIKIKNNLTSKNLLTKRGKIRKLGCE